MKDIHSFRQQLVMVEEQEQALEVVGKKCKVVDEHLKKKSEETSQNAVNFLRKAQASDLLI